MVDFIYNGETNVCSENIDAFLALAEELQIKGLTEMMIKNILTQTLT